MTLERLLCYWSIPFIHPYGPMTIRMDSWRKVDCELIHQLPMAVSSSIRTLQVEKITRPTGLCVWTFSKEVKLVPFATFPIFNLRRCMITIFSYSRGHRPIVDTCANEATHDLISHVYLQIQAMVIQQCCGFLFGFLVQKLLLLLLTMESCFTC